MIIIIYSNHYDLLRTVKFVLNLTKNTRYNKYSSWILNSQAHSARGKLEHPQLDLQEVTSPVYPKEGEEVDLPALAGLQGYHSSVNSIFILLLISLAAMLEMARKLAG